MPHKTLIFVPTFNERENVEKLSAELLALVPEADLLFIDDNSPDGTGEVLDGLARAHTRLSVIHRPGKQGIGSAHSTGIAWAYDQGYSRLVTMDCDFTHSPFDVVKLLANSGNFGVTVGSRFLQPDSLSGWGPVRVLLTYAGHAVTKTFLRLPFDASGALRVYNLALIPRGIFARVLPIGYAFFFESLLILVRNGVSVQEIPITLPSRVAGHSKMTLREMARGVWRLFVVCLLSILAPRRFKLPLTQPGNSGDRKATACGAKGRVLPVSE
jgi:dolichol-phosphate mannosyltransferase